MTCTNPLHETQVADSTGHTHTVTIPVSDLIATTAQTIDHQPSPMSVDRRPHTHMVTLTPANLATLKGGGRSR